MNSFTKLLNICGEEREVLFIPHSSGSRDHFDIEYNQEGGKMKFRMFKNEERLWTIAAQVGIPDCLHETELLLHDIIEEEIE